MKTKIVLVIALLCAAVVIYGQTLEIQRYQKQERTLRASLAEVRSQRDSWMQDVAEANRSQLKGHVIVVHQAVPVAYDNTLAIENRVYEQRHAIDSAAAQAQLDAMNAEMSRSYQNDQTQTRLRELTDEVEALRSQNALRPR